MAEKENSFIKPGGEVAKPTKTGLPPAEMAELGKGDGSFFVDLRPKLTKIPDLPKDKTTLDVRYPLVPPYAFVHIFWDKENSEIVYHVEEPVLDDTEKELLRLVQLGLEEMINISFIKASKFHLVINYLERTMQSILLELGAKVSKDTYQKLMYFIYRDSVGLNEIEPLLMDFYIEDIECNGSNFPLYIVHRKYQNLKTNVVFKSKQHLTDFVEKLAQKSGRYVSYANPLLDATLPDGSRVNATYTEDVTTRGPTFTIRKFTKDPWTPTHLIKFNTLSAEIFAYLWLAIENKFNIMVIGETAAGKTTFLNSISTFIPPESRICSIEDTRELNLSHINWLPSVTRSGFGVPSLLGKMYGEVTLFDLLKETFRQNPDYVIVGETRGEEASVLFQGMASGHPSFSTFHAASVETLVKRLETPPINLPASLVETLDIICVATHIKTQKESKRRLREVIEISKVKQELGAVDYNTVFEWRPVKDVFKGSLKSVILDKINKRTEIPVKNLRKELNIRTKLLSTMVKQNLFDFRDVTSIVNQYYKDPKPVLARFKIK